MRECVYLELLFGMLVLLGLTANTAEIALILDFFYTTVFHMVAFHMVVLRVSDTF